jgi:HEAT repeat protein
MEQKELLRRIAKNSRDWLTRHNAEVALENLTLTGRVEADLEGIGRMGERATEQQRQAVRDIMSREKVPTVAALRAAGKLKDVAAVPLLAPWLKRHEWEYHAAEAAVALGRIGTTEAVTALWSAVRSEVPNKQVVYARYLQHGPRPEEYALLKGLILAGAKPALEDVPYLIALLPNTFMEKPRFEDRMRPESQRVLMPRLLLDAAGFRRPITRILVAALQGKELDPDEMKLNDRLLEGINLERPFSEHGRPFAVVKKIGTEEALWLLTCFAKPGEVKEELVIPYLTSQNHRERIDAAVLLGLQGFGPKAADALLAEAAKPYSFPEIWSMGKGMPDENFRDKAYMAQALAQHIEDIAKLRPLADPKTAYRDVRYGLTRGLARREQAAAIPLLLEMAANDPITLVRQQARYAIADIQDAMRLRGQDVPAVTWPSPKPLESLYPPRPMSWADTTPDKLPQLAPASRLKDLLVAANFRNLSMAQARGADRMMIHHVAETAAAMQESALDRATLIDALQAPYPYANYLAAVALAEPGNREAIPVLVAELDTAIKTQSPVAFWWTCEALAKLKAVEALPALARFAVPMNPAGIYGPPGMANGYVAAKALAQIAGSVRHPDVIKLLAGENMWLRAGTLRGLAEAHAEGIEGLLMKAMGPENAEVVRQEARVQLRRLNKR